MSNEWFFLKSQKIIRDLCFWLLNLFHIIHSFTYSFSSFLVMFCKHPLYLYITSMSTPTNHPIHPIHPSIWKLYYFVYIQYIHLAISPNNKHVYDYCWFKICIYIYFLNWTEHFVNSQSSSVIRAELNWLTEQNWTEQSSTEQTHREHTTESWGEYMSRFLLFDDDKMTKPDAKCSSVHSYFPFYLYDFFPLFHLQFFLCFLSFKFAIVCNILESLDTQSFWFT